MHCCTTYVLLLDISTSKSTDITSSKSLHVGPPTSPKQRFQRPRDSRVVHVYHLQKRAVKSTYPARTIITTNLPANLLLHAANAALPRGNLNAPHTILPLFSFGRRRTTTTATNNPARPPLPPQPAEHHSPETNPGAKRPYKHSIGPLR